MEKGPTSPAPKSKKETIMKKLLIATLAAAAAGMTFADDLCNESTISGTGCAVYNVKFNLKTLAAKKSSCGELLLANSGSSQSGVNNGVDGFWTRYVDAVKDAAIAPAPAAGTPVKNLTGAQIDSGKVAPAAAPINYPGMQMDFLLETRQAYWADNATRTWEGILWQCQSQCIDGEGGTADREYFVMWEKKAKRAVSLPAFRAWNKDQATYKWFSMNFNVNNGPATAEANESRCFWFLGRYGQKAQKVAVGWNPTCYPNYGLHAAGFGSFYSKDGENRMTSVTGNCAGMIAPLVAGDEEDCDPRFFVQIAYVCQTFKGWCCDPCYFATTRVPAYGTWSLRYNASLSKGKKPLSQIIPNYAVFSPENYNVAAPAFTAVIAAPLGGTGKIDANGIFGKGAGAAFENITDAELDALAAAVVPVFGNTLTK